MPNAEVIVLDTSVILHSSNALRNFGDKEVVIPYVVLEEIDKFKTRDDEVGRNARHAVRFLNELRSAGSLSTGVSINDKGGILRIELNYSEPKSPNLILNSNDDRILNVCLGLKENSSVTLVSKDINLLIRADVFGIKAKDFFVDKSVESISDIYTGTAEIIVEPEIINRFYAGDKIYYPDLVDTVFYPNQYLTLISSRDEAQTALARVQLDNKPLARLRCPKTVSGLTPRNREQQFLIDALTNKDIPLVSVMGSAGTGKTICSLASALHLVQDEQLYNRFIVSRPIQPMGKDIGYLPGPQPLDAKVLTPNGWTTMGELEVGSEVISRDGKPTKILGIYPKGKKAVYRVTTTDGTSTECCLDHLWYTRTAEDRKRGKPGSVKLLKEIVGTLAAYPKGKKINSFRPRYGDIRPNHFIPRNEPVQYNKRDLVLPPYLLGCLLGDGNIGDSINLANTDSELIEQVREQVGDVNCRLSAIKGTIQYNIASHLYNNKTARPLKVTNIISNEYVVYASVGRAAEDLNVHRATLGSRATNNTIKDELRYEFLPAENRWQNPTKEALFKLGLDDVLAWTKFIPEDYKYSSIEDRVELLKGLMDTDGTVKKRTGEASFCTTSIQLALDVIEVVRSLGGRATFCSRDRVGKKSKLKNGRVVETKRVSYEFTISLPEGVGPFFISRKADRQKPMNMHGIGIVSVEYVGEKEVQCIRVDNPEHLYITDEFIVTHNTQEEKLDPWMGPIKDAINVLRGPHKRGQSSVDVYSEMVTLGLLEIEALTYLRGRSFSSTFFLIDEAEDLSRQEMKTIVSRMGENSKIVLIGDIMQITNPYVDEVNNGLSIVAEKFKEYQFAAHLTMIRGERSLLASTASQIL